jgi:hypothetical protein
MRKHALGVLAFIAVTFAVQASSHFVVNTAYYAAIPFMRADADVVFPLGFLAMIVQGVCLTWLYSRLPRAGHPVVSGLKFSLVAGAILASYIAFAEPAKYAAPSIPAWIAVEGLVSLTQFAVFGILLGLIHGEKFVPAD